MTQVRRAYPYEIDALIALWLRSVRATHTFLGEVDIQSLLPLVRDDVLPVLELWVWSAEDDRPMGFMGLDNAAIEALFVDPGHMRKGGGKRLLDHARARKGPLTADVNEQNPAALAFYLANGFEVIGRSPVDSGGRPFPLLHLRECRPRDGHRQQPG